MGGRGSRGNSVSDREIHSVSPSEKKSQIDPYIVPTSIDDSILLKDPSRSYLTPTPFPAPILNLHDRDALCSPPSCSKPRTRLKMADVTDRPTHLLPLSVQPTSRTPSPLSPLSTSMNQSSLRGFGSASQSPMSPASSTSSIRSPPPEPPSPTPSPPPLSPRLVPPLHTCALGVGPQSGTALVPVNFERLESGNMRLLLAPAPPPPAYTQYAIGQGGGKKDPGSGRLREWGPAENGGADVFVV